MENSVSIPRAFRELDSGEIMIRGGYSWGRLVRDLMRIGAYLKEFMDTYGDDIREGFKEGWESA